MYATHHTMVMHSCAKHSVTVLQHVHVKNGKSLSKKTEVTGQTQIHVKNSVNLTLRSKINVVLGSWMYTTHRLIVIHPCVKYGKTMSKQNKVMGRTRICTDRRTDKVISIYPPELHSRGYKKYINYAYKQKKYWRNQRWTFIFFISHQHKNKLVMIFFSS